jgi:predicted transcriptional regulator of viral defense system
VPSPRQDLRRALHAVAFQQAGYFTAAQALEAGYSYQAQKYHADAGNWVRIDRGIFRLPEWPTDPEDVFVRWTLWSDGRGVVSHDSALAIHGLSDVDPVQVHLTVPTGFGAVDEMVALHVGEVGTDEREARRGWAVTTPLRTLVDAAVSDASQEQVDRSMADALRLGLTTRRRVLRAASDAPDRAALRLERALAKAQTDG